MNRTLRIAAAAAVLGFLALPAQAAVQVAGGRAAEACSRHAFAHNRSPEAIATCNQAFDELLSRHDRAGTHVNRGVLLILRKDYAEAQRDLDRAVLVDPSLGEAWVNLGYLDLLNGRFDEGVAQIEKGLALGVEAPGRAYFARAVGREWMNDLAGAYQDYSRAAELEPRWTAPREQLTRFTVNR